MGVYLPGSSYCCANPFQILGSSTNLLIVPVGWGFVSAEAGYFILFSFSVQPCLYILPVVYAIMLQINEYCISIYYSKDQCGSIYK